MLGTNWTRTKNSLKTVIFKWKNYSKVMNTQCHVMRNLFFKKNEKKWLVTVYFRMNISFKTRTKKQKTTKKQKKILKHSLNTNVELKNKNGVTLKTMSLLYNPICIHMFDPHNLIMAGVDNLHRTIASRTLGWVSVINENTARGSTAEC